MDALSDVLRIVRLTGAVFMDAEFGEPWCIGEPAGVEVCIEHLPDAQHVVFYHLVTEGRCQVSVAGQAPVSAGTGDLVVIPGGEAHALGSDLSRLPVPGEPFVVRRGPDDVPRVRHGGGGAATRMVCGYLACHSSLFETVLAALPRVMIVSMRDGPAAQWLTSSIRFSVAESAAQRTGAGAMLAKISELMFLEAIRRHIETMPADQTGWLAGLRDPSVGRALALIHSKPAGGWTVEELARAVGVSRSVLAERFTSLVGQPPMQYLARWRLRLAGDLLRSSRQTVAGVAGEVGYESEAAFSRAFKREMGLAPAAWRRSSEAPVRPGRGSRDGGSSHSAGSAAK
ncbi:MAG TPA: AraC family transcriptional regulator [Candidatus Polarisedimenticolia bacterium]|nr:AraC family transcriptional regulator [Candidatus Polarisedimenticolia bacterium]